MKRELLLAALKRALEQDPRNGPLWIHYGEELRAHGEEDGALAALRTACELAACRKEAVLALVPLLVRRGELSEALLRAEAQLEQEDDPELRLALAGVLEARGDLAEAEAQRAAVQAVRPDLLEAASSSTAASPSTSAPAAPAPPPERPMIRADAPSERAPEDWAKLFDWGDLHVTLKDVVGLPEVKRQVHLRIVAPFKQPEVYEAFGRDAGGGLLLYGPPGCGKTFVARATAGELGARFVALSIHEILDKYWGESEKLVHALFEDARKKSPTVLFFDEFDALGGRRSDHATFWRVLVDQILQEMDGFASGNRDLLFLAATNLPWSVDPAFRRPGRFDRVLFVSPPDEEGRAALFRRHAARLPGGASLDFAKLAKLTPLFTGADVRALCDRAAEGPLEAALESGRVVPVTMKHFEAALKGTSSSALEWLAQARNFARYSNDGGHYDPLVAYLKAHRQW